MDNYIIKVAGKAEVPEAIAPGHNWRVSSEGSIVSETISDNDDGTYTHTYLYKPVRIELLTPLGATLKLKDTRSRSQLFRARVWSIWKAQNDPASFDDYYDRLMGSLIEHAVEITEMYR